MLKIQPTYAGNNNISFNVKGEYSERWFSSKLIPENHLKRWEPETLHILEHYSNKELGLGQTYIDIGAWIGPTVLYAANIYDKVIAIEPDPAALFMLQENLSVNNFSNISVVDKALSDKIEKVYFGGNGELGNSESTLLVNVPGYFDQKPDGKDGRTRFHNYNPVVEVETITFEKILEEQEIDIQKISLIKMDIEGGELIAVPAMQDFLKENNIPFYLSLHHVFLKNEDSRIILDILFDIYENCYDIEPQSNRQIKKWQKINKQDILSQRRGALLFIPHTINF